MGVDRSSDLLVNLVTALEEHGLDPNSYRLNDTVNVDALTQLVSSGDSELTVIFTIQDYQIVVTGEETVEVTHESS